MIDSFTVIAQIVNFLILILLLRRFLYKPVLKAIEARKNKIASEVQAAEDLRTEAEKIKAEYELKIQLFENDRKRMIDEALKEAHLERARRMEEVKEETEALRKRLMRSFGDQQQAIENQITRKAREEVLAITRKVFSDLASKELEGYIVDEFLRQLELSGPLNQPGTHPLKITAGSRVVVRTAFDLQPQHRQRIAEAISRSFEDTDITTEFGIKKSLVCGVELQIDNHKIDWNFSGHLNSIHQKLSEEKGIA